MPGSEPAVVPSYSSSCILTLTYLLRTQGCKRGRKPPMRPRCQHRPTTAITAKSTGATSPDGLYSIQSSRSEVSLVDSQGQSLITLIPSMTGGTKIEISWAPTSKRVVVANEQRFGLGNRRGLDRRQWRDLEESSRTRRLPNQYCKSSPTGRGKPINCRIAYVRRLGIPDELQIKGNMKFSNHKQAEFSCGIEFGSGVLVTKDYKFTLSQN
jgi:hypothetical protein